MINNVNIFVIIITLHLLLFAQGSFLLCLIFARWIAQFRNFTQSFLKTDSAWVYLRLRECLEITKCWLICKLIFMRLRLTLVISPTSFHVVPQRLTCTPAALILINLSLYFPKHKSKQSCVRKPISPHSQGRTNFGKRSNPTYILLQWKLS